MRDLFRNAINDGLLLVECDTGPQRDVRRHCHGRIAAADRPEFIRHGRLVMYLATRGSLD